MGHGAYCWLSGGQNVGSFLCGNVLVKGCECWMLHRVCQADPLQGCGSAGPCDGLGCSFGPEPSGSHAPFAIC